MEVKHYKILRTLKAQQNERLIFDYIKNKVSIDRANYVIDGIDAAITNASKFPTKHRIEPSLNRPDIRFTVKWSYKIVFQIKIDSIIVLTVFHTAQRPMKLRNYLPS